MNAMLLLAQVAPALTDSIAGANPVLTPVAGPEEMNLWSMAVKGGWIMIVLGLLSILCFYILFERNYVIRKAGKEDPMFMDKIKDYILDGEIKAAIAYCRSVNTPAARMIEKGISRLGRPVNDVQAAIENVGNIEVAKLEKGLTIMATISGGAPMIGFLGTVMEGAFRPGHFNGVCQIVSKLFDAVQPDRAYFGEKDFQQLAIIREMVRQLKYNLEIVGCSIVREEDGLALSSRNKRLSAEERENALNISRTLFKSRNFAATHTVSETQKMVEDAIEAAPGLRMEYSEIVDGNTLQKISNWEDTSYVVGCITVFCGEVRLIDNIKYKE